MRTPASITPRLAAALVVLGTILLTGCSTVRPWQNEVATQEFLGATQDGTRTVEPPPSIVALVSLSGGGARAAAFGLGVLQEMEATRFRWENKPTTLLDHVSLISGVSGGSILAAYYAAFGAEGLKDFEKEFLLTDIQGNFISRALSPSTAYRLTSPWFGRSNALAEQLDELYKGKTFGDVARRQHAPELLITATDLTTGASFEFTQEQFRLICSDLSSVPLSFAVASSSSVPILLSPTTLRNYSADCPLQKNSGVRRNRANNSRTRHKRQLIDESASSYLDAEQRPFIHLVDGGLADNLGVRQLLDRAVTSNSIEDSFRDAPPGSIRTIALIVVNSERDLAERIDQSDEIPSTGQVIDALVFGAGSRSTLETLAALHDNASEWTKEINALRGRQDSPFAADAEIHVIPVSLRDVENRSVRHRLLQVPTAFTLPPEQVRQLVESGRATLRTFPAFQGLMSDLQQKSRAAAGD